MATIGLDRLYYAKITENENGEETYDTPVPLAKAITAELSVELAEATLYADDGAAEVVKEFQSGTLTLGVADIGVDAAEVLTGATLDDNKVRVKFGIPATNLQTKGDSITFSTPTIEGTVMRRNKPDGQGKHPWKAEVSEDDPGVSPETITGWYTEVYEPVFAVGGGSE